MKFLEFVAWQTFLILVGSSDVPSFLSSLVYQASVKKVESFVVLFRLEDGNNEDFFNDITSEVMRNNAGNSFVISKTRKATKENLVRVGSFIIATVDSFDFVSNLNPNPLDSKVAKFLKKTQIQNGRRNGFKKSQNF